MLHTWWSSLLVLLAALTAVVLLHLWRRPATQRRPWGAMRLLAEAVAKERQRLAWRQRALLVARMGFLFFLLTAVMLPQPWVTDLLRLWWPLLNWTQSSGEVRGTHYVLVFDATLSMTYAPHGVSCWQRALREAKERLVLSAPPQDAFSVILLEAVPHSVWNVPCGAPSEVLDALASARPSHGAADVVQTLHLARQRLERAAGLYARQEVHLFTDMQAATWQARTSPEQEKIHQALQHLQQVALVRLIDVGQPWRSNYAITSLHGEKLLALPHEPFQVHAAVRQLGAAAATTLPASLWLGRIDPQRLRWEELRGGQYLHLVERQDIRFPADRDTMGVTWTCQFSQPGLYVVQMRVAADDGLSVDNSRMLLVQVRDAPRIVLVDGMGLRAAWESDTGFLQVAWNNPQLRPQWTSCTPLQMREPSLALAAALEQADVWAFSNVPEWDATLTMRLEKHLQRGGNALFFLGDAVKPETYAATIPPLLRSCFPLKLLPKATTNLRGSVRSWGLHPATDTDQPLVRILQPILEMGLAQARFQRFWPARLHPGVQADVLLNWMGRDEGGPQPAGAEVTPPVWPALVASRHGQGRVLIFTHGASLREDRFPLHPAYLPLMQELLWYLLSGEAAHATRFVGEPLEGAINGLDTPRGVLTTPDGKEEAIFAASGQTHLRTGRTRESGWHRLSIASSTNRSEHHWLFAVQPQVQESGGEAQPRRLSEAAYRALHPAAEFTYHTQERHRPLPPPVWGLHPAWWCLCAAQVFLLLELRLSRRASD